ncbi:MAG TPA: Stp1/IreP family PP2C-type Ser/Thr phosphatase [Ktedonobacterales bacterium]
MTKILRLSAATLTDVGKRRERNQDNVTEYVPDDPDLLAERGALFVVADGMGGHAAGEIASQIAVETIREQYFLQRDEDIITALARAIEAANNAIFDHAREHQAHGGMGTTCVLVVLAGGRAYFANIGDSRAYLLREGEFRQVTRDHSWVAEQVRAGILTEEQARTHPHRNVITRSLGTQPEITADLFIEIIHEGDRVLLCSDGLHGYVTEDDIQRVVTEQVPEDGVQRLIDMANANGGPDNITAVIVELKEVPAVTEELRLPAAVGVGAGRAAVDASLITTLPIPRISSSGHRTADAPGLAPAAAAVAADGKAARRGGSSAGARRRRTPWPMVALRVVAAAALLIFAVGMWDITFGPFAAQRAGSAQLQQDIAAAQSAARAATTQNPTTALNLLSTAQQRLQHDLATLPADAQTRAQAQQTLQQQVAPAVRLAVTTYNQQNGIVTIPATAVTAYTVSCAASLASGQAALAAAGPPAPAAGQTVAPVALYALAGNGAVYLLTLAGNTATCGAAPLIALGVKALATDGPRLYALAQQTNKQWVVLAVDGSGKASAVATLPADAAHTPLTLAAHNGDLYIAFAGATPESGGVWHFTSATPQDQLARTITVPQGINALAVTAAGKPFALLLDGSLVSFDAAGHLAQPTVAVATPVPGIDPSTYTVATPVPTLPPTATPAPPAPTATPATGQAPGTLAGTPAASPSTTTGATPGATASATTTTGATATATPAATAPGTLAVGRATFGGTTSLSAERAAGGTLEVGDGSLPRVVRFAVVGMSLTVQREYVYGAPLQPLQSVTTSPDGTQLYAWSGAQLVAIALPS